MPTTSKSRIFSILSTIGRHVPAHSNCCAKHSSIANQKEYAFEYAASSVRYGKGVTVEVGQDFKNWGNKRVQVLTDQNLVQIKHPGLDRLLNSLASNKIDFDLFSGVKCEPTDSSFEKAIQHARRYKPDAICAFGGGSVMDTAKAVNLFVSHPENTLLDFVNTPIGKGQAPRNKLLPLVAIPTTAGTGSETTGVAIFDYEAKNFKTGIAHRYLKPTLGIIDPLNTATMPKQVKVASGLDVLCHSLESFTAIPYTCRPRPSDPILRPAYQGRNPISDIWSIQALEMCVKHLEKSYKGDQDSGEQMMLAAMYAGVGFGNAGVHLCHGLSYPISGLCKSYQHPGYHGCLVPHGIAVAISSPAVFKFTAPSCPDRHLKAAEIFGADISNVSDKDAGLVLSDALREFLFKLDVPDGISAFGYSGSDIEALVEGTLPQHRVTQLSPEPVDREILASLIEDSMKLY